MGENTHTSFCTGKPLWSLGEFSAEYWGIRAEVLCVQFWVTKMVLNLFYRNSLDSTIQFQKDESQFYSCVLRYIDLSKTFFLNAVLYTDNLLRKIKHH